MNNGKPALRRSDTVPYLVIGGTAFLLTAVIVLMNYLLSGIVPFGGKAMLYRDGGLQMVDLFCWYKDVLSGSSPVSYSFGKSLGGNTFAVFSYYLASPLSLLLVFFDKSQMPLYMSILFVLKASLASCFAGIYLTHRFAPKGKEKYVLAVMLSISYGLSQYFISQNGNTMWLDGAYMLPLVLMECERHAGGKKSIRLIITLALALCFNWYSGLIDMMFAGVWIIFELIRHAVTSDAGKDGTNGKDRLRFYVTAILRFGLACICSLMIAAAIIVPTLLKLSNRTYNKGGLSMLLDPGMTGNALTMVMGYSIGMVCTAESVSLFAGSVVLLGVCMLFAAGRKPLKEKILYGGLLVFTVLMFYWQPLAALFSLLRHIGAFWCRYSYLGIFVLIFLAATFYLDNNEIKVKAWMPAAAAAVFSVLSILLVLLFPGRGEEYMVAYAFGNATDSDPDTFLIPLLAKILFPLIISLFMSMYLASKKESVFIRTAVAVILCVCVISELIAEQVVMTGIYSTNDAVYVSEYIKQEERLLEEIEDDSFYRVIQTTCHSEQIEGVPASYNEPMAFGFNSVTSFVSDPDEDTIFFMDRAGYAEYSTTFTVTPSENLALDSLLGVKYVMLPSGDEANTGLEYYSGISGFKDLYYNPYALPVAFAYEGSGDYDSEASESPLFVNDLFKKLTGTEDVFIPIDYDVVDGAGDVSYQIDLGDEYDPEEYILYAELITDTDSGGMLIVNGEDLIYYSGFLAPSLVRIDAGEKLVTVSLDFYEESEPLPQVTEARFYLLDTNKLKEAADTANANAASVSVLEDGYGSFSIDNQNEEASLFISVPSNSGWVITRNGNPVEPDMISGLLMSVPLEKGQNTIEMRYKTPRLTEGIIASISGVVLLAVIIAAEEISTRRSNKSRQTYKKRS
ncbi:MAG: YfhO family protein [Clostridiales bacterium]|nr:YfhO family protein [Clostridiales bacterium]